MVVQDESGCPNSDTVIASDNRIFLDIGAQSLTGVQLKEIYTSMDDYAPKVRKPYTITKQREKWTEEEHKKFLEALKLHGRSWRKIEEHVGTKTAVQIRSHAQKFFSKVVRESNGSNESSVKSIEIPPPRPKRKPMHPYPRQNKNPQRVIWNPDIPLLLLPLFTQYDSSCSRSFINGATPHCCSRLRHRSILCGRHRLGSGFGASIFSVDGQRIGLLSADLRRCSLLFSCSLFACLPEAVRETMRELEQIDVRDYGLFCRIDQ